MCGMSTATGCDEVANSCLDTCIVALQSNGLEFLDLQNTVEPRFNDLRLNDIPGIMINIRFPGKSYSKMYGAEPQFNHLRFNDIPRLTMGILFPERKIFPGITIKSLCQTTRNAQYSCLRSICL